MENRSLTAPTGVTDTNRPERFFRRLTVLFVSVQVVLLLLILAPVVVMNSRSRSVVALTLASSVRNHIVVGDIRSAISSVNTDTLDRFIGVAFYSGSGERVFSFPPSVPPNRFKDQFDWLTGKIEIPLTYDGSPEGESVGHFVFLYHRLDLLVELMTLAALWVGLGYFLFRRERKQLAKDLASQRDKALAEQQLLLSKQIAHDIRSPLSALNLVISTVAHIPEEKRLIIRNAAARINDIANGLLGSRSSKKVNAVESRTVVMLASVVDRIISEKRTMFMNRPGVVLDLHLQESYGLFAEIDVNEFSKALSNLINNAVESYRDKQGIVSVLVTSSELLNQVIIVDKGQGIPDHLIERLGKPGVSFGKDGEGSGSGLGIYQARTMLERAGGELSISSQIGVGTEVTMNLPKAKRPNWFVERIVLASHTKVVSVDDDTSIHSLWSARLNQIHGEKRGLVHLKFFTAHTFKDWLFAQGANQNCIFLIDYTFNEQSKNGLDLIEDLGLQRSAILVSSMAEDPAILERAGAMQVKLLPKSLAYLVPLDMNEDRT